MNKLREILEQNIALHGEEHQKDIAIEECAELINSIEKQRRGRVSDDDVITEIADVLVAAYQLAIIYGTKKVFREIVYKVKRLHKRNEQCQNK